MHHGARESVQNETFRRFDGLVRGLALLGLGGGFRVFLPTTLPTLLTGLGGFFQGDVAAVAGFLEDRDDTL